MEREVAAHEISVFFFQAEDGIRDHCVTGVQTCALPIYRIVALYWEGGARAAQGDGEVAERLFTQVLAEVPRSYYGVLAATRLPGRAVPGVKARVTLPDEPSQAVAADPGFARVELLRRIGLVEEAIGELEELAERATGDPVRLYGDRKSTRLNSSHTVISYAVFCLKKKKQK